MEEMTFSGDEDDEHTMKTRKRKPTQRNTKAERVIDETSRANSFRKRTKGLFKKVNIYQSLLYINITLGKRTSS